MYYLYPPPPCAKNNCVDCSWNMSIVFGLCQLYLDCVYCVWILRFYLDCMIVFGLYNCILIMSIVFGLCGIWQRGCNITSAPLPLCRKSFTKKGLHVYRNVAKVILGLWEATLNYVDCRLHVNCMSIVLIVFELCRSQGFRKTLKWIISINILPILEKGAMLWFHTSDTDTIVGPDPPNPMVNWYSWHKVGAKGGAGPPER